MKNVPTDPEHELDERAAEARAQARSADGPAAVMSHPAGVAAGAADTARGSDAIATTGSVATGRASNVTRLDGGMVDGGMPRADAVNTPPQPRDAANQVPQAGDQQPPAKLGLLSWLLLQMARAVLPLIILGAAFAGYKYLKDSRVPPAKQPPQETRFAVQTVAAKMTDVQPRLQVFGTVVAGREVQLRALVAGRVIDTSPNLRDGSSIERSQMMLVIDPFEFQTSIKETEAQLAEAKARREELEASVTAEQSNLKFAQEQLDLGERDFRRARQLSSRGNLAQRTVDDRQLIVTQRRQSVMQFTNNLRVQQARVRQQTAAIERLTAVLSRNRQRLADTRLVAPFDGYLTGVNAQVGRMLSVNDAVATLIDRDAMDVRFTLSDQQFGRLATSEASGLEGRLVNVTWDVGGAPVEFKAIVDRVAARVSSTSGGVDVFARVQKPDGPIPLRPGAFVQVAMDDVLFEDVMRVPASSVYNRSTVYAVVEGRLAARKVEVIGTAGVDMLVRGDLKPGEKIAVTRLSTPGTGVAVVERSQ